MTKNKTTLLAKHPADLNDPYCAMDISGYSALSLSFFLRCFRNKIVAPTIAVSPTTPPTVPPTIAPIFPLFPLLRESVGFLLSLEDEVAVRGDVVDGPVRESCDDAMERESRLIDLLYTGSRLVAEEQSMVGVGQR